MNETKMLKVKCIDNTNFEEELTIGKEYEVLSELYELKLQDETQWYIESSNFEIVEEDVKNKTIDSSISSTPTKEYITYEHDYFVQEKPLDNLEAYNKLLQENEDLKHQLECAKIALQTITELL